MSDGGDSVQNSARSGEAGDESLDESQQQLQQEQEEEEQQQLDDTTAQPAEEVDADADADEAASPTDAAAAPSSSTGEAAEAEASPDAPSSSDSPSQSTEAQPSPDTEAQTTQQTEEQAPSEVSQKEEEESKEQSPEVANDPVAEKVSTGMQASDMTGDGLNDSNADEEISTSNAGNQAGGSDDQLESLEREDGDEQQQQQNDEDQPMVQVEITILPDGFKHSEVVPLRETVLGLKSVLSERFKLPTEQMRLALGDLVLDDQRELAEYREFEINRMQNMGVSDEEAQAAPLSFVLNIELSESEAAALATSEAEAAAAAAESSYRMPDILKVVINREELELEAEEEEEKELNGEGGTRPATERTPEQVVYVQVIRDNLHYPKPFLGGFRHKYYGTIYHHASSQTARKKKKMEVVKFHRETQTIQIISRSQQTNREAGTQMERRDLLLDHSNDHVIMSKPYFTADELEALRDLKAREIQCFLRQCFAWRRVRRLREAKADKVEAEMKARALKAKLEAEEHARQIQRRMHPRTKEDFAVLFAELEAWRLHETQRIKESGLGSEEIAAALQELLNKEVKLLQTIDRLKITAAKENKWTRTQTNLEKMASPKEWSSREGDLIEVETPFTTRAKELVDLYNGLCLRNLSRAQRVDVLLHIKYTVKEFDCELSRDIVELIKREEDLLRRQRSEASLEGCRKRLQNLFLQFVNTPAFNPEASNFARVPPDNAKPPPPIALSSSLAKPAMFTKTNTITVASNVAGRIFANKQ